MHSVEVWSSRNSPPLFVIVLWGETNRSSLSQMFSKISALKNFANVIGKHQCWSIFLIKLQAWRSATLLKRDSNTGVFLCEICEIFKNTFFYRTPPVAASVKDCIIFLTSSRETSLNWNFFCILYFSLIFKTLKWYSCSFSKSDNDLDLGIYGFKFKVFNICEVVFKRISNNRTISN